MTDTWDRIGYVISSGSRTTVLARLADRPATPSQIADEAGVAIGTVSTALSGLSDHGLVELLVPEDRRKGRVYGITSFGETVWTEIHRQDLSSGTGRERA
ncbi:MarR family transcriptional regulator [Halorubrum sp. JWXQ-INN 858]|uniref:winged helix-turn-helix domain-containing protein n=1 Tax=Halorubrum sp. JWXQ-INN 858 TaxID=2690782 RepID=UPI0013FAC474|nr:winged helix-turn-helix domain-containing protein [Halorubrum sp. JWXQ-INN 858]MWV65401.1 MarR family transcriptional regulator [Halorubrum sp. JWXQ-INN 858]